MHVRELRSREALSCLLRGLCRSMLRLQSGSRRGGYFRWHLCLRFLQGSDTYLLSWTGSSELLSWRLLPVHGTGSCKHWSYPAPFLLPRNVHGFFLHTSYSSHLRIPGVLLLLPESCSLPDHCLLPEQLCLICWGAICPLLEAGHIQGCIWSDRSCRCLHIIRRTRMCSRVCSWIYAVLLQQLCHGNGLEAMVRCWCRNTSGSHLRRICSVRQTGQLHFL